MWIYAQIISAHRGCPRSGLRSGPRARRGALGDFSNPLRTRGDLGENPLNKIRILYTYFLHSEKRSFLGDL